jgi:hypothetical protein
MDGTEEYDKDSTETKKNSDMEQGELNRGEEQIQLWSHVVCRNAITLLYCSKVALVVT